MRTVLFGRLLKAFGLVSVASGMILSPAAAAARQYSVSIANMSYGPVPSALKVGDSILWINKDSVPHTVTARDHSFDLRIGPGQKAQLSLAKAGTYQVYCIFHAPMRATLIVTN